MVVVMHKMSQANNTTKLFLFYPPRPPLPAPRSPYPRESLDQQTSRPADQPQTRSTHTHTHPLGPSSCCMKAALRA